MQQSAYNKAKFFRKKIFLILSFVVCIKLIFVLSCAYFCLTNNQNTNWISKKKFYLTSNNSSQIENDLTENVQNQLEDIDFSKIDNIVNSLDDEQKALFGGTSFLNVVKIFYMGKISNLEIIFFNILLT